MNGLREKAHGKYAPCSRTKPKDMQRKKAEEQLYSVDQMIPHYTYLEGLKPGKRM